MKNLSTKRPILLFKKVVHKKSIRLLLLFNYDNAIISKIKKLNIFTYTNTFKGWHCEYDVDSIKLVYEALKDDVLFEYDASLKVRFVVKKPKTTRAISETNKNIIRDYVKFLKGRRYSHSTVNTYFTQIADFIEYVNDMPLKDLTHKDVENYIAKSFVPKGYSISTQRQLISAVKLFVEFFADSKIDSVKLIRPKKSRVLPTVLSKQEIIDLLRSTQNLKHRAVIAMIYSAGLRISELISLKLISIDIDRRQIVVKNAKGRKDRNIILAQSMIPLLSNYLSTYQPKVFFAEGSPGKQYAPESVRSFLRRSCKRAGISKHVTPHTLRHSYATHLLENGIDLRYIQELLGHVKPETTMIYTHVSKKDLLNIESPLDLVVKDLMADKKNRNTPRISGNY